MDRILNLFVCDFVYPEVSKIIIDGDFPDVKIKTLPGNCNNCSKVNGVVHDQIAKIDTSKEDVVVVANNCVSESRSWGNNVKIVTLKQCFGPLVGDELIFHYYTKGYYVATNGWIRHYKSHIKNWGFEGNSAGAFFKESMKQIIFLDTLVSADYHKRLTDLSNYMQIPYEIIPIGMSYGKAFIQSLIHEWRYEKEHTRVSRDIATYTKQQADMMVVMAHLEDLVKLTDENKIINMAINMVYILFAPNSVEYIKYKNEQEEKYENPFIFGSSDSGSGYFEIPIVHMNEKMGNLKIKGLAFEQHLEQYKIMGKTIGQIFSIAISNARKYEIIIENRNQIENYSKQLELSNNTKDKFFSIIAHDLKGPISSALGLSELLMEDVEEMKCKGLEKHALLINNSLNETINLLSNLLEWSRSQLSRIEYKPVAFNLLSKVKEVKELLALQIKSKELQLQIDVGQEVLVFADVYMVGTIFRNLISNAIKYSNVGDTIIIDAKGNDRFVKIFVKDQGVGMDNKTQNALFDISTKTSKPGTRGERGTGLGLVLCKEFVEKNGGVLWVDSIPGSGTTFFFSLPNEKSVVDDIA